MRAGRTVVKICSVTKNPIPAWMAPSTVVTLVVTTSTTRTNEMSAFQSVGGNDLLLEAVQQTSDAGDGPGEREDHDALPGGVHAEAGRRGFTPPHGRQVAATVPLRTSKTTTTATMRTPSDRRNIV